MVPGAALLEAMAKGVFCCQVQTVSFITPNMGRRLPLSKFCPHYLACKLPHFQRFTAGTLVRHWPINCSSYNNQPVCLGSASAQKISQMCNQNPRSKNGRDSVGPDSC